MPRIACELAARGSSGGAAVHRRGLLAPAAAAALAAAVAAAAARTALVCMTSGAGQYDEPGGVPGTCPGHSEEVRGGMLFAVMLLAQAPHGLQAVCALPVVKVLGLRERGLPLLLLLLLLAGALHYLTHSSCNAVSCGPHPSNPLQAGVARDLESMLSRFIRC